MRRFIICAIIIALMTTNAGAEIQEFKYFSLDIPEDWQASEKLLDNGASIVAVVPEDDDMPGALAITSGSPGDLTIEEIAIKYANEFGSTEPDKPNPDEELYTFDFNDGKGYAILIGNEDFYMLTVLNPTEEESATNRILGEILDSLEMK